MGGDFAAELIFVLIVVAILCFSILGIAYLIDVHITESNIISVYMGDTLLYRGKSAFVAIESGGMTTTVRIYDRLFPIPHRKAQYSDPLIRVYS